MGQALSDPWQAGSRPGTTASAPQASQEGLDAHQISLLDSFGERRQGFVLRRGRWDDKLAADLERLGGDFRIVIVDEPPEGPRHIPPRTVICAPAAVPKEGASLREAVATYDCPTKAPRQSLAGTEMDLLSRGRLHAAAELTITPDQVFAGAKPRLELLAREILASEALASYLGPLAVALSAPDAPVRASSRELMDTLRRLLSEAEAALDRLDRDAGREAAGALERLSALCAAENAQSFLAEARRLYPQVLTFLEDVYLLRALTERLAEAQEMLAMRAFVAAAEVPPTEHDLALDKAIVKEQIQFASLVPEPQRLNTARAALDHFRRSYKKRYEAHHQAYWTEMAHLHGRLLEGNGIAEALRKLNTLTELGPPVGEGALSVYRDLLDESSGCSLSEGLADQLGDAALCPACGLRLDQQPPAARVWEIIQQIERATQRQIARLSSLAVRQVLEESSDPRVERFLKVVQAAQLASLPEILDDELVGYLRRFLVEARIDSLLRPVLSRLEQGASPRAEEAQEALRELARVLDRAFRASARALPPPRAALKNGAGKKTRR